MKFNSTSKTPGKTPKVEEKLFENIIDNLGKPKVTPSIQQQVIDNSPKKLTPEVQQKILGVPKVQPKVRPKVRVETMSERIERITYQYDENDKRPKHLDDPLIVSQEDMTNRNLRPKQFSNLDPNSYPSNPKQKKALTTWEIMVDQAKNPQDKYDRESAKQVRETILDSWKKPTMRKYLGEDELELIGRSKKQLEIKRIKDDEALKKLISPIAEYKPFIPSPIPNLNDYLNDKSLMKPGISKDLLELNADIDRNMKYVLEGDDQKEIESEELGTTNDNKYKEVEDDR